MDEGHVSMGHVNPYLCLAVCVTYLNRVEVSEWNFVIDCSEVRGGGESLNQMAR